MNRYPLALGLGTRDETHTTKAKEPKPKEPETGPRAKEVILPGDFRIPASSH